MKDSLSSTVGKKIRFYRKHNNLSLEQLAIKINKSKSTLSKYENGSISIDIETLLDISKALNINLVQLIDYNYYSNNQKMIAINPFKSNNLYLYYYDGRSKKIVYSYLIIYETPSSRNFKAALYLDIPSFKDYEKCHFFYIGQMNPFDLVTYFTLLNQTNPMERLGLCVLNSFYIDQTSWGLMFGISNKPIAPFALKFLLSTKPLDISEITFDKLSLSPKELKKIKQYNMIMIKSL